MSRPRSKSNAVPPTFTIKPRIREEDDGNRLVFECELNSLPVPEAKWYKDGVFIDQDEDHRFSHILQEVKPNHFLVHLVLDDVIEIDEGNYRVVVKNLYGEVDASIRLNFDRKLTSPTIT